jgi:2-phospho-L-lactate guanylyltransferase
MDAAKPTRVFALVPVGPLEGAKTRLATRLDAEERRDLVARLVRRTVEAAVGTWGIVETIVVTPDPDVRSIALEAGARPLRQGGTGLNEGLEEARAEATAAGADAVLVLPVDLPLVDRMQLDGVIAPLRAPGRPLVVLVPDRHERGTNVLLVAPPDAIPFAFGGDSRAAHAEAARAAGARYVELDGPLTLDLDTPDDLLQLETIEPQAIDVG